MNLLESFIAQCNNFFLFLIIKYNQITHNYE